jgi:hypothetical protein
MGATDIMLGSVTLVLYRGRRTGILDADGNFNQVLNSPIIATLDAEWLKRQNFKPKGAGSNPVTVITKFLIQEARV